MPQSDAALALPRGARDFFRGGVGRLPLETGDISPTPGGGDVERVSFAREGSGDACPCTGPAEECSDAGLALGEAMGGGPADEERLWPGGVGSALPEPLPPTAPPLPLAGAPRGAPLPLPRPLVLPGGAEGLLRAPTGLLGTGSNRGLSVNTLDSGLLCGTLGGVFVAVPSPMDSLFGGGTG